MAVLGSQQVGGNALGDEVGLEGDGRVERPGGAVRAHHDARHGFDAATDGEVDLAGADLGRSEVHGFKTGTAVAVDLDARHALVVVGIQRGDAADVAALLLNRRDATEDHVLDQRGVELVAFAQRDQRLAGQVDRRDFVQLAVGLALAARSPHAIENVGISHLELPVHWKKEKRNR